MKGLMAELLVWYAPDMQHCAAGSHLAPSREVSSAWVTSRCFHLLQTLRQVLSDCAACATDMRLGDRLCRACTMPPPVSLGTV